MQAKVPSISKLRAGEIGAEIGDIPRYGGHLAIPGHSSFAGASSEGSNGDIPQISTNAQLIVEIM